MTSRILLTRHGQPEAYLNPALYREGDANVSLNKTGWEQAARTGVFLGEYCVEVGMTAWPLFYVSPLLRAKQSTSAIVHGMGDAFPGEPTIYLQPFLSEKFFGAASALAFPDGNVSSEITEAIQHLSRLVYKANPFVASHLFGESTKQTLLSVKMLMEGTLNRDVAEGHANIVMACHGEVILATVMAVAHIDPQDKEKLGEIGHGDVIEIAGEPKNWTIRKIFDGVEGKRVDINLLENVRPFSYQDLPPVPDFLKRSP